MKKLISIFGPSECQPGDALYGEAVSLGSQLAALGFVVVTGGYEGVMEAASMGAREAGGTCVGITAEVYFARGREANRYLSREVRVKSAADALMELLDIGDAYVAIGNSPGTLTEVIVAWDYMKKRFLPQKPLLLVGDSWREFLDYADRQPFFADHRSFVEFHESVDSAAGRLSSIFGPQHSLPDLTVLQ